MPKAFLGCLARPVGRAHDAGTIGVHVSHELRDILDERGGALSMTRSRYGALVFEWWKQQGCPAVTPADQAMQDLKALKAAEAKATYAAKKKTG